MINKYCTYEVLVEKFLQQNFADKVSANINGKIKL